jgi:hypothetical protein
MSVNTKYTDKPNDQYQRANLKGLVGYFHKRYISSQHWVLCKLGMTSKHQLIANPGCGSGWGFSS